MNGKKSQECRRGCMQAVPGILSNFYNKDQKVGGGGDFSIPFLSPPSSFCGFIIGPYGFLFLKKWDYICRIIALHLISNISVCEGVICKITNGL